jgi:hypothetical protein
MTTHFIEFLILMEQRKVFKVASQIKLRYYRRHIPKVWQIPDENCKFSWKCEITLKVSVFKHTCYMVFVTRPFECSLQMLLSTASDPSEAADCNGCLTGGHQYVALRRQGVVRCASSPSTEKTLITKEKEEKMRQINTMKTNSKRRKDLRLATWNVQ